MSPLGVKETCRGARSRSWSRANSLRACARPARRRLKLAGRVRRCSYRQHASRNPENASRVQTRHARVRVLGPSPPRRRGISLLELRGDCLSALAAASPGSPSRPSRGVSGCAGTLLRWEKPRGDAARSAGRVAHPGIGLSPRSDPVTDRNVEFTDRRRRCLAAEKRAGRLSDRDRGQRVSSRRPARRTLRPTQARCHTPNCRFGRACGSESAVVSHAFSGSRLVDRLGAG